MRKRSKLKKSDLIIISLCLIPALIILALRPSAAENGTALIYRCGELQDTIDLEKAQNQTIIYGDVVIEIQDGKIGFTSSSCKGKDCIHTGFISHPGQASACLPERTVITITGSKNNLPDAISY